MLARFGASDSSFKEVRSFASIETVEAEGEEGPPSATPTAGAGEAKQARGSEAESSYSVGRYPEIVAHRMEPVRSKVKDETVGYAYRCAGPKPRVRRV